MMIVEVDGFLDQPLTENSGEEIKIFLGILVALVLLIVGVLH